MLETNCKSINAPVFRSIIWLLFLSIGIQVSLGIVVGLIMAINGIEQKLSEAIFGSLIFMVSFSVTSALIILPMLKQAFKQLTKTELIAFLGFKTIENTFSKKIIFVGIIYYALSSSLIYILNIPTPEFMLDIKAQTKAGLDLFLLVIAICIMVPLMEEVIFRGVGYGRLKNTKLGIPGSIVFISLLFTVIQLQYEVVDMLAILPFALLLGNVRYKTEIFGTVKHESESY